MTLSVILITKNEAHRLDQALASVAFADECIVLDSGSTDETCALARSHGAKVFLNADWQGFGVQKNRALAYATGDWVLSLDADEWVSGSLAQEIQSLVQQDANGPQAYAIPRRSKFIDRYIRFCDWRGDAPIRLFRRGQAVFSEDLVHERLIVRGRIGRLQSMLMHESVSSLDDANDKMWRYARASAAQMAARGRGGWWRGLASALFSLVRGLVLRAGLLDGLRGLQLAFFNARGGLLRYSMAAEQIRLKRFLAHQRTGWDRLQDWLEMWFVDHGLLRALFDNRYRLPGGLYRVNQPSPLRLARYVRRYGIRSVINLRGDNPQLGWYRLEQEACDQLGLRFHTLEIYSRGLLDADRTQRVLDLIRSVELPAIVHCKSGADRAGFFSVLYRHARLGEPIEQAQAELDWRYGHFRAAKTGVLDYCFETFRRRAKRQTSFLAWLVSDYDAQALMDEFKPQGLQNWLVDQVLRRE
jgi:glycosyltransferase involved in cell wall biosynthesis